MTTFACHVDFPRYVVGDDGSVTSLVFRRARQLKPVRSGNYLAVTLLDRDGSQRRVYLHRLVAETFHGAPARGHEARHLDGCREHNSAQNVVWGTRSQNMRDKERHGTAPQGERHGCAKLTAADVIEMRRMHAAGATPSQCMARFNVSRMTHWRVVNRALWKHVA